MEQQDNVARRIETKLVRELGELAVHLEDPEVVEIMVNPDSGIWVEKLGSKPERSGSIRPAAVLAIINTISASLGKSTNAENPILEGELPIDGSRFEGLVAPLVTHPTFSIRKRASRLITLDQYVADGILSNEMADIIIESVNNRHNILISGGTGSGKTTLANAILALIVETHPSDRVICIEDTYELQCAAENKVMLHSNINVSMQDLLKATLRLRPDRIVVGEVRGSEALALLKAWNTGHPGGCCTVHANDPSGALQRLESLAGEGITSSKHLPELITDAVDLVVQIARAPTGGKVTHVAKVASYDGARYITHDSTHSELID